MFRKLIMILLLLLATVYAQSAQHSNTLTWAWAQGTGDPATGFHVQRSSTSGGPYTVIATLTGTTVKTYVDTSVVAGQTLYYVVTAFNGGGDSTLSNQVTCVTPFQGPGAPTGLSGTVQ